MGPAAFAMGAFATTAQVLCFRELLVACSGSEIVIGVILAGWLLAVGAGGMFGRLLVGNGGIRGILLPVVPVAAAVSFPLQVAGIRSLRLLAGIPIGEELPFGLTVAGCFLLVAPSGFCVGLAFPLICAAFTGRIGNAGAIGRTYSLESAGSVFAGLALSFVLLPHAPSIRIALLAVALAAGAGAFLAARSFTRLALGALVVVTLAVLLVWPSFMVQVEKDLLRLRWPAFGIETGSGTGAARLVAWDESRYQSLALVESAGQHTLYGNGEVLSTLPDPVGFEHLVHFVMAQKPRAHSALLIGGAVQGEGAELLKYPISRLVHVELDPAVGELLRKADPVTTARVASDPRLELVSGDAPRYAARCREKFDVVFVMAPQPSTAAANRFYTVEFYRDIRRVMGPSSFFYTSVVSSERMEFPAADIAASVYRTLRGVFGDVRVTAGSPTQFFAAIQRDVLTMDPGELAERSRTSSVSNTYFRPEYFMGADELDPAKIAFVEERLRSARGPLNSWDTPVTYFHAMRMWSRVSGPVPEKLLEVSSKGLRSLPLRSLLIAVACLLPVMGFLARPAGRNAWQGPLMLLALSITGGAGLAAELLSIHAVQGIFGYVYAQIGLIVAAFMAGLWAGAAISGSKPMSGLRGHVGLAASASLLCFVLWAIPLAARTACAGLAGPLSWVFVGVFYVIVLVGGLAVGAQFPLAAAIYASSRGCGPGHAAAMAEAADVAGAAAGGATVGILLLPALGMNGACSLAAAAELVALGAVAASFLSSRPRG